MAIFQFEKLMVVNSDSQLALKFFDPSGVEITDTTTVLPSAARIWMGGFADFLKSNIVPNTSIKVTPAPPVGQITQISFAGITPQEGDSYMFGIRLYDLQFWLAEREPVGEYYRLEYIVEPGVTSSANLASRFADMLNARGVYSGVKPYTATVSGDVVTVVTPPGLQAVIGVKPSSGPVPAITVTQKASEGSGHFDIVQRYMNEKETYQKPSYEALNQPIRGNKYVYYSWKVRKDYPDIIGGDVLPSESRDTATEYKLFVNESLTALNQLIDFALNDVTF